MTRTTKILATLGLLALFGVSAVLLRDYFLPANFQASIVGDTEPKEEQKPVATPVRICREIARSSAQVTILTAGGADLAITKTVLSRQIVHINEQIQYRLNYTNLGPDTAVGVRMVDDYDETRIRVEDNSLPQGCSDDQSKLTCVVAAPLPKDGTGVISYTATALSLGTATNVAVISSQTPDQNQQNNTASASVNIVGNGPTCTLTATPPSITSGQNSTLNWNIQGKTTAANIQPGIGSVLGQDTGSRVVTPTTTTTYVLTVTNDQGTNTCSATVTVGGPNPTLTLTKQANPTVARRGETITYTLNYANPSSQNVTSAVIRDDYDEVRLTDIQVPNTCIAAGGVIVCNIGNLSAAATGQISYTAKIADAVENNAVIHNVAVLTSTETSPVTAEASVTVRGLILDKSVSPGTLVTGQDATYRLTVENALAAPQTFTLRDVLGSGDNGGALNYQSGSVQVTFTPANSGTFAGSTPDNFIVTNLAPGAKIQIEYKYKASDAGINFNQSSKFRNVVTIVETGDHDEAEVIINGPTSGGGCTRNCGGGGGGGGSRPVPQQVNLDIQKEVKDQKGVWQDANTFDVAAMIPPKVVQRLQYRIQIKNIGKVNGEKVEVQDLFESPELKRVAIRSVKGASYDVEKETFALPKVAAGGEAIITYEMLLSRKPAAKGNTEGHNTATITNVELPQNLPSRTRASIVDSIGENDPAFIRTKIMPGEVNLFKTVDRAVAKPGEEVHYTIRVVNKSGEDLRGVILTDLFPFDYLDFVSASQRGITRGKTIEYRQHFLRKDQTLIINVTAKVKNTTPGGTKVKNFLGISAENIDLSAKHAETEFTVVARPLPGRLIRTGGETLALLFLAFGAGFLTLAWKKKYRV